MRESLSSASSYARSTRCASPLTAARESPPLLGNSSLLAVRSFCSVMSHGLALRDAALRLQSFRRRASSESSVNRDSGALSDPSFEGDFVQKTQMSDRIR